jgi:hypothetical protein
VSVSATRAGEVPVSPRLRFETVAGRWLERFEAKVAAGERHPRTARGAPDEDAARGRLEELAGEAERAGLATVLYTGLRISEMEESASADGATSSLIRSA